MTSSPHGLYVQGYSRATMVGTEGCEPARASQSHKAGLSSSVADHPLRPATHRGLGELLPHQQANGTRAHPKAIAFKKRPPFSAKSEDLVVLSGISSSFPELSQTLGQITHALLTRAPLYSPPEGDFLVRLACLRHAASVRSEPGSNSPI